MIAMSMLHAQMLVQAVILVLVMKVILEMEKSVQVRIFIFSTNC